MQKQRSFYGGNNPVAAEVAGVGGDCRCPEATGRKGRGRPREEDKDKQGKALRGGLAKKVSHHRQADGTIL